MTLLRSLTTILVFLFLSEVTSTVLISSLPANTFSAWIHFQPEYVFSLDSSTKTTVKYILKSLLL